MSQELTFASWLRQRRNELGLTRDEFAERLGFSLDLLKKLESGERRPSGQIAHLLADYFRISSDERDAFVAFARTARSQSESKSSAYAGTDTPQSLAAPWRRAYAHSTNLPAVLTPLLGREKEVAAALQQVKNPGTRLLTLTGAPGIGKTRLALHIASELIEHFEDGVFFVDLAPLVDPGLVLSTIARTLGLKEAAEQSIEEMLFDYARDKRSLVLLDNFEQVLDAAPGVARLLEAGPWLKALVTSREALHVRGEHRYPVPPLGLPHPKQLPPLERLATVSSVELFVQRAQAASPDFALTQANAKDVAAVCVGLEGLPLAIELAAARTRHLTPREMRATLHSRLKLLIGGARDFPARQRTLYAAIEWSYNLLDQAEQRHFRRLGVFVGGFTPGAAVAICGIEGNDTFAGGLASLADKNLIRLNRQSGTLRFTMLETIHEYARQKLEESGEAEAIQGYHADYFLKLAQESNAQLFGANQLAWLDRLEEEHDNFRAALGWVLHKADVDRALELSGSLGNFWFIRGYWSEARRWLQGALGQDQAAEAIRLEEVQEKQKKTGKVSKAGKVTEASAGTRLDTPAHERTRARATVLTYLGMITVEQEDIARGRALLGQSVELSSNVGYKSNLAWALFQLGMAALGEGNRAEALSLWKESLGVSKEVGSGWITAIVLPFLGDALVHEGDYQSGILMMEESLAIARASRDRQSISDSLTSLGEVARKQGDYERALTYYEEGLTLTRQMGFKSWIARRLSHIGFVLLRLGKHERAVASLLEGLQVAGRELGHKESIVLCLVGLAGVAALSEARGNPYRAGQLVGAADALIGASGHTLRDTDQMDYELIVTATKEKLGQESWQQAYDEGWAMSLEEALALALEDSELQPFMRPSD